MHLESAVRLAVVKQLALPATYCDARECIALLSLYTDVTSIIYLWYIHHCPIDSLDLIHSCPPELIPEHPHTGASHLFFCGHIGLCKYYSPRINRSLSKLFMLAAPNYENTMIKTVWPRIVACLICIANQDHMAQRPPTSHGMSPRAELRVAGQCI